MAWVLRRFAESLALQPVAYTDWDEYNGSRATSPCLFVREAFVSGHEQHPIDVIGEPPGDGKKWVVKDQYHLLFDQADAYTAVKALVSRIGEPSDVTAPTNTGVICLVHAVVEWLGWSTDHVPRDRAPLVRKATKPNWDQVPNLLREAGAEMPVALRVCFDRRRK